MSISKIFHYRADSDKYLIIFGLNPWKPSLLTVDVSLIFIRSTCLQYLNRMAQFILKLFKSEKSIFQTLIPIFYHFTSDKKVRFQLHNI